MIVMMTAYDYPTGKLVDEAGVDYILVGDSLGMVVLGYPDTKSVTLEDMLHHTKAVVRGVKHARIIADMPIGTYEQPHQAVEHAQKCIEAGAWAVKIEGFKPDIIQALTNHGIRVVGHLGLLPQTADAYKVQGKNSGDANRILEQAISLDTANLELLVLECIPSSLAKKITESITTYTIGIGAGKYCDGQVLVLHDVIGLSDFHGKFVRKYANIKPIIRSAVAAFAKDVREQSFPTDEESFK